jgi:hypothetical protein
MPLVFTNPKTFSFSRQAKDRYFYDGAESLKGFPTSEFDMEMKQTDDRQSDIMGPTSLVSAL